MNMTKQKRLSICNMWYLCPSPCACAKEHKPKVSCKLKCKVLFTAKCIDAGKDYIKAKSWKFNNNISAIKSKRKKK
jgi:hypothetical protein